MDCRIKSGNDDQILLGSLPAIKESGTPTNVFSNLRTLSGTARADRSALACRRPTTALAAASEHRSSAPDTHFLGRGRTTAL
jgi:hypothetical protein